MCRYGNIKAETDTFPIELYQKRTLNSKVIRQNHAENS